jgi:tetratricopeptide (TPR) repeat protein
MQIIVQIYRNHYQQIGKDSAVEKSVRALFDQVATEQPENGTMLVLRSEFEEMMGKSDDAEKYLRQFLDKPQPNPRDRAVVLNNLAYRLAIRGEGVESEQLVSEAEKLLGPRHDLRDTKGMVYLAQRKYQNAIDEFQESINSGGPGAIKYLHLALAFWQNGDKKQAVEAVKDAQKMNVDDEQMTGFERQQYIDLLREMKRDGIEL